MGQINPVLPTAGSTLNSVADPQLITALTQILGVINGGIDPTNLNPATGIAHFAYRGVSSGTVTANNGDFINAAAGVTVTLPPPSSANQFVVVNTWTNATGASPVTVNGTHIIGPGLNLASTFLLGAPGAAVVLQSDGANWQMIAGQQDTGWVALTLGANVVALAGAYTPAARVVGTMVFLCGTVVVSANSTVTIPAGARPASQVVVDNMTIPTSGVMTVTSSLNTYFFDGMSYRLI